MIPILLTVFLSAAIADSELLIQQAQKAYDTGDYSKAIAYFRDCVDLHPDDPTLLFRLTAVYRRIDMPDEIDRTLTAAVSRGIGGARLYTERAEARYEMGRYDDAVSDYEKALAQASSGQRCDIYLGIAKCLREKGEFAESRRYFDTLLELRREPEDYYEYGKLFESAKDFPEAVRVFRTAKTLFTGGFWRRLILNKLSYCLFETATELKRSGKTEEARECLREIVGDPQLMKTAYGSKAAFWLRRW